MLTREITHCLLAWYFVDPLAAQEIATVHCTHQGWHLGMWLDLTTSHWQTWLFSQLHINVSPNRPPDRTWRRPPGRPRNKWLDQLRNDSTRPTGDLWRRAIDCEHGGATTRRPSPATRSWWWWSWLHSRSTLWTMCPCVVMSVHLLAVAVNQSTVHCTWSSVPRVQHYTILLYTSSVSESLVCVCLCSIVSAYVGHGCQSVHCTLHVVFRPSRSTLHNIWLQIPAARRTL